MRYEYSPIGNCVKEQIWLKLHEVLERRGGVAGKAE